MYHFFFETNLFLYKGGFSSFHYTLDFKIETLLLTLYFLLLYFQTFTKVSLVPREKNPCDRCVVIMMCWFCSYSRVWFFWVISLFGLEFSPCKISISLEFSPGKVRKLASIKSMFGYDINLCKVSIYCKKVREKIMWKTQVIFLVDTLKRKLLGIGLGQVVRPNMYKFIMQYL